jgi:hypothetical protein
MASENESPSLKEDDSSSTMLFEPVLVISRLAQLSLYPLGTKLYVRGNTIRIQEYSVTQPLSRWMSGDSREDLTYLYDPIRRFSQIYRTKTNETQRVILRNIIDRAIQGIEKLRNTYGTHRIIDHSLAYYQTFLVQCVRPNERTFTHRSPFMTNTNSHKMITEIPQIDLADENERSVGSGSTSDSSTQSHSDTKLEKLSGVWALDDIRMLRTMLNETEESSGNDHRMSRLDTLGSFLNSKELEVQKALDGIHRP